MARETPACERPYVFVDGTRARSNRGRRHGIVAVLVEIGAGSDGFREAMDLPQRQDERRGMGA